MAMSAADSSSGVHSTTHDGYFRAGCRIARVRAVDVRRAGLRVRGETIMQAGYMLVKLSTLNRRRTQLPLDRSIASSRSAPLPKICRRAWGSLVRVTQVVETSIPALLRERASSSRTTRHSRSSTSTRTGPVSPEPELAAAVSASAQRCTELRVTAAPGDRALILAPQSVEYIVGFLGALQAGLIPVPLAVPLGGVADERVDSVLRDALPTVILTTSAVAGDVARNVAAQPGESVPAIVEVDRLDLDARVPSGAERGSLAVGELPVHRLSAIHLRDRPGHRPAS